MLTKKLSMAALIGVFLASSGLFAADIMNTHFDGDALNTRLGRYITNVSNLIPDSTSLQNVWSLAPETNGPWFGAGFNASFTFYAQKDVSRLTKDANSFTSSRNLADFPEAIPYLPGIALDFRAGISRLDVGFCFMWIDDDAFSEGMGTFLGEGNHFSYRMLGVDLRYVLVKDGQALFGIGRGLWPAVTLQGGYYFTWLGFGISAGDKERVNAQFRNDTLFFSLQLSKKLPIITPYLGMKLIFSKTDSEFDWETHRPVVAKGKLYPGGAHYYSGIDEGEFYTYFQFSGGLGISIIFPHVITIGGVYNVVTNHFGINLSVRAIFGSGVY